MKACFHLHFNAVLFSWVLMKVNLSNNLLQLHTANISYDFLIHWEWQTASNFPKFDDPNDFPPKFNRHLTQLQKDSKNSCHGNFLCLVLVLQCFLALQPHRFSYLSGVGARGLLNLGKYHLSHQKWEFSCSLKELDCHFKWIKNHIRN